MIKALKQAQDYVKGSFSNSIRMITIANEAICVGLNFEMVHHGNVGINVENFLSREGNSVIEKLLYTQAVDCVTTIVLTVGKKVLILNINEKNKFVLRVPANKGFLLKILEEFKTLMTYRYKK